jgi:phosphoribosyl 1,2-cyclic phosphate phosphodiesterase
LDLVKELSPNKTILTNLHSDLDYDKLKKILPSKIVPAFDGLKINL